MMSVGALSVIYWRMREKVSSEWFLFGGVVWALAIAAKVAMDLTISNALARWLADRYELASLAIIWGLVVGLRTGYLECGFTYIACIKSRLKKANFVSAVAFGIGFGAVEAMVLGFTSLINILALIFSPELINLVPPQQRELLIQQFSMGLAIIPAPIIERFFTLMAHIFSAILIIYAVQVGKAEYFLASFAYKSLLDGMIPWLNRNVGIGSLQGIYTIETIVIIYGFVGLMGTLVIGRRFGKPVKPGLSFKKAGMMLLALLIMLMALLLMPEV
jgi:uncharacterized membrane protein YhfC